MPKIFISHSSANSAAALAVGRWLEEEGWADFFLDIAPSRGLAPGERWQAALRAAADRCEAVLFLISPAWRDSSWCLAEFLLAKQLGKAIFGVLIESTPLDGLPKEMTSEWQLCDLVAGVERRVFRVSSAPVVPETEVWLAEPGLARLKIGLQKAGLDPSAFPWPPPDDPERRPYRGLRALDVKDAAVFFGREAAIVRGLDAMRALREQGLAHMLVILGASGAGKSSFLRAGLWPRLQRADRHFVPLPIIRPERAPISGPTGLLTSLEAWFREHRQARTRAVIRNVLEQPGGFASLLAELQDLARSRLEPDALLPTVVIPVDQGEELYTAESPAEAAAFLVMLSQVLTSPSIDSAEDASAARPLVVVAIRSDSYERMQTDPRLEGVRATLFDLRPLAHGEFKAVIEGPSARATAAGQKLTIDPRLSDRLLGEVEGADALPLLAFTLERLLVEHGADGDLSLDDYESLGGLRGSIEVAVKEAFAEPGRPPAIPSDAGERNSLLRQGFVPWLARVDPETEERKRRVARWDEISPAARPLLERLIEQRLLVRDRRRVEPGAAEVVVVEVAHEALLRQWRTLTVWLDEDADALKVADAVRRAAEEWLKNGRGAAWLVHTGGRLETGEVLQRREDFGRLMGDDARVYLEACRARDEAQRAERETQLDRIAQEQARVTAEQARTARAQARTKALLAVVGVILLLAGGWIVTETRAVARQTSFLLAAEAEAANDAQLYDQALRLAVLSVNETWLQPAALEGKPQLRRAVFATRLRAGLRGHEGKVHSAAFSGDGRRVVTASLDKTARVWDAETGKELAALRGHEDMVVSAAFSGDGRRVVTASLDKTARVWDPATGKELAALRGHQDGVRPAAFSGDGRRVVTASEDQTARVWDAETGKELAALRGHQAMVVSAAFSGDGRRVVTASLDKTARVWDAATGKELAALRGHEGQVWEAAFSGDGRRVVTASADKTPRVWDAETGKELAALRSHEGQVQSAAFSGDGQRVVTASLDKTARVWDAETGKELAALRGHEAMVVSAAFSGDGQRVVTASLDKTARVWDAETGKELAALRGHEAMVVSAAFSRDGRRVVTASADQTARVWDAETGKGLAALRGHEGQVRSAAFSGDGRRVVTAAWDKTPRVWDAETGKELAALRSHEGQVQSAAFSGDGRRVVTASLDKTPRVWDAETGKELAALRGHEGVVRSAAFSRDGRRVVTASADQTARVWDAETGKELAALRGHEDMVVSAAFSRDGRRVVTASADQTARVWDAETGKGLAALRGHEGQVRSAAFSGDGRRVVTAALDKTPRVWDAQTGKELAALRGHEGVVRSAAFSGDGRRVVTASEDKTARVWDAEAGKELAALRGHAADVVSAAFSEDGRRVVTASMDRTARVWDAETGKELAALRGHEGWVWSAGFSGDGRRVVTASEDKTARLWDVLSLLESRGPALIGLACAQKLSGASTITASDTRVAPILRGREGEDVCAQHLSLLRMLLGL